MNASRRVILAAMALFTSSAHAVPILDQEFVYVAPPGEGAAAASVHGPVEWAQTFTVGISGRLARVELLLNRVPTAEELLFDVRPAVDGIPSESAEAALYLESVSPTEVPVNPDFEFEFVSFELGDGIPVSVGDVLAIVLRSPDSFRAGYGWSLTPCEGFCPDRYPRGQAFFSQRPPPPVWAPPLPGLDLMFRTFVEPTAVSEPSVLALLAASIGAMGLTRARSSKYRAKAAGKNRGRPAGQQPRQVARGSGSVANSLDASADEMP